MCISSPVFKKGWLAWCPPSLTLTHHLNCFENILVQLRLSLHFLLQSKVSLDFWASTQTHMNWEHSVPHLSRSCNDLKSKMWMPKKEFSPQVISQNSLPKWVKPSSCLSLLRAWTMSAHGWSLFLHRQYPMSSAKQISPHTTCNMSLRGHSGRQVH